jgi:hypothetical protein
MLFLSAVDSSKEGSIEVLSAAVGSGLLCKIQILTQLLGCPHLSVFICICRIKKKKCNIWRFFEILAYLKVKVSIK